MPDIVDPPVAPAAAPDSPAPATPEAAPAAAPSPSPATKAWTDAWDALDLPDAPAPKPEPPKATPEKPVEKPEAASPVKPVEKEADKPAEKPKADDELPAFRTNKEVREFAKAQRRAAKTAESKLVELENKLKELEAVVPKSQQGAELLAQQLADARKQIEEHEREREMTEFEKSKNYRENFFQPWVNAKSEAQAEMIQFSVNEKTSELDEDGNPIIKKRQATAKDFDIIYGTPDDQVREKARAMFGEDYADVLAIRRTVGSLAKKATVAIDDHAKNLNTHRQQEMAQKSQQEIALNGLWKTANEKISQDPKRAMYWGEDKDDPDANKALANGFKLADEFFSEKRENMGTADKVEFDAYIRHTIAMGPKLAYKLNKAMAENQALKDEVAQLRGSAPGTPKPISEEQAPATKGFYEQLNELPD